MSDPRRGARPRSASGGGKVTAAPLGVPRRLVVDRFEGRTAVLVEDGGGGQVEVAARSLPADCREEGAVLMIPAEPGGGLRWADAVRDRVEEEQRRTNARARLDRLRRDDGGGDLAL